MSSSLRSEPVMEFWGSLRPRLARGARAESVLAKKLKNRCFIVFSKKSIFFLDFFEDSKAAGDKWCRVWTHFVMFGVSEARVARVHRLNPFWPKI